MKLNSYAKYAIRFLFLQIVITYTTIFYFDKFLVSKAFCENCAGNSFIMQINNNLWEDRNRFFSFISEEFITLNYFLILFVFLFLIILYSTKFYTYVNELSFSIDRNYLDEYLSIYLLWTSSLVVFITMFRISSLISRGNLLIFTFIVPLILMIFRNSEFISSLLGRSVTNEKFITINLEKDSIFRNLRIATFRNCVADFSNLDLKNAEEVINVIDGFNKKENINLIILNIGDVDTLNNDLENYLINLNKKVLIISTNRVDFKNYFINRSENVDNFYLTYFNNDIQYGSKYILKRVLDIVISLMALVLLFPLILLIYLYIGYLDGFPTVIKQNRVGLHGNHFNMYKFRTMKQGSHGDREVLQEENKHTGPLFKLENDPRIINGTNVLRKFSLDELPQFVNVLKGEMSVVGPRPLFEEDTQLFDKNYMRRLNVLPGITGLLQINERNTPDFSTWYKYDIEYIDNWSIYLDMKIILKTPFSLFKSKTKGL